MGVHLLVATTGAAAGAQRPADLVDRTLTARVVTVADGDTVEIMIAPSRLVRVRLHGVDAPEMNEASGSPARNFLRVLLFDRKVQIAGRDIDPYDRLVARIRVGDVDASEAIVEAGLACTFRRYASDPRIEAAVQRARAASRGFWAPGATRPGCVAREAAAEPAAPRTAAASGLVGNVRSRVFHLPSCRNATCQNCTRRFATREEAERAGFRPAGDCMRY